MNEIRAEAKSIRKLLAGSKFSIDYYQREYKWQTKQLSELLNDLAGRFFEDHTEDGDRAAVAGYGHYFLGSIIISEKAGQKFIIDGQQRLTTLTLLLIYLHNLQRERDDEVKLDDLIFSEKFGKKSFNLDVDERTPAMEALFNQQPFDPTDRPESVQTIVERYRDIEELFLEDIADETLPYFIDWLIENVHLVEITAYSDDDAYTIFETMNDRGLSLTPLDMLKGFVLANITDQHAKIAASKTWKKQVDDLRDIGKDEDADAFKAWLRSQYADSIRERKKGAKPEDFDRLATEFHRWVKEHDTQIGLKKSDDFARWVERDLHFYTRQYARLRKAALHFDEDLDVVYYNARLEFTLQYPLLLAPLTPDDDEVTVLRKLRIVGSYIDILLARRLWNFRLTAYSTMQYAMFVVMREIRGKDVESLTTLLRDRLEADPETFASNDRLRMHQQNRYSIHQILARLTDHLEKECRLKGHFAEYVAEGKNRYEVEHIWADHAERHLDEFGHAADFAEYRNRIGGLLLVPKSFNASYGDQPYDKKLPHYRAQNVLAQTLHAETYAHNPGLLGFVARSGIPFTPHGEFKKADIDTRQAVYTKLAEHLWNPSRLEQEAAK